MWYNFKGYIQFVYPILSMMLLLFFFFFFRTTELSLTLFNVIVVVNFLAKP